MSSKKKFRAEDLDVSLEVKPGVTAQGPGAPAPLGSVSGLDRRAILAERRSGELMGKHFLLPKALILKLRIRKKQRRAAGQVVTEAALVTEMLEAGLADVQIPEDWRDAF